MEVPSLEVPRPGVPRLEVPRPRVPKPGVPRPGVTRPVVPRLGLSGPGVSRPRETQTGPDWGHQDGEGDQNQRYTPPAVDTHVYEYSEQGAQTKVTRLTSSKKGVTKTRRYLDWELPRHWVTPAMII